MSKTMDSSTKLKFSPSEIKDLDHRHRVPVNLNQRRHRNPNRPVWEEKPTVLGQFFKILVLVFIVGIIEAARIDGASEWKILFTIVLPMSKAVTAVIALFYGVGFWNAFFNAVLYIDDSTKWPLQMVLRQYVLQGQAVPGVNQTMVQGAMNSVSLKMAIMVLAILPIVIIYPFVQKHFTKGVIFGAIKG